MPSVTKILAADVPVGQNTEISIPGLRQGDIKPGTRVLTVDGVEQPEAKYSVDLTFQKVTISNEGPVDWMAGSELLLTWEGVMIEAAIIDIDDRVAVLEANIGVTDGSNALPGQIGEYVVQANTTGITLVTDVPAAVCSINLTPGVWEIWGSADFRPTGNNSPNMICAAVSLHPDALPTDADLYTGVGVMTLFFTNALSSGQRQVLMTGQCRANSTTPLNLHLIAQSSWTGGSSIPVLGYISARRVR